MYIYYIYTIYIYIYIFIYIKYIYKYIYIYIYYIQSIYKRSQVSSRHKNTRHAECLNLTKARWA